MVYSNNQPDKPNLTVLKTLVNKQFIRCFPQSQPCFQAPAPVLHPTRAANQQLILPFMLIFMFYSQLIFLASNRSWSLKDTIL